MPEEPALQDRPVRPVSNEAPLPGRPTSRFSHVESLASRRQDRHQRYRRWQILDSTNFRIYHADPALAAKVAKAAESARIEQSKRWGSPSTRGNWNPLCGDLSLHLSRGNTPR